MKAKATKQSKKELLQQVERGLADVHMGRTKSQEEVKEALAQRWDSTLK
jgi:predicted transcriptional regulator